MKYSFVMLTKNRRNILPLSIQSVLNQTFKDFDFIIADDGEDKVEDLIESYDDNRIKYYYKENFKTLGKKFNFACSKATGKFLCIFGDDDCTSPYRLEVLNKILNYNSEIKYVNTSQFIFSDITSDKLMRWSILNWEDIMCAGSHANISSEIFWNAGGFDESLNKSLDHSLRKRIFNKYGKIKCADLRWVRPQIGDEMIQHVLPKNIWKRKFVKNPKWTGYYYQTPLKKNEKKLYGNLYDIYKQCQEKFK